jgi:hypothetical protein
MKKLRNNKITATVRGHCSQRLVLGIRAALHLIKDLARSFLAA